MLVSSITNGAKTKWRVAGLQVARSVRRSVWTEWHVLGFSFRVLDREAWNGFSESDFLAAHDADLFFDIALGGGTEVYFRRQAESIVRERPVVRVQFLPDVGCFRVSLISVDACRTRVVRDFAEVHRLLSSAKYREVIVNNLVSWPDASAVLAAISEDLRRRCSRVVVCGHDFYPVCPTVTMLADGHRYCGGPNAERCAKCRVDIGRWRKLWEKFLSETADEIRLFSESEREIFAMAYPGVAAKMKVIPHFVPPLRKVSVPPHDGVNVVVLGAITYPAKGLEIVAELDDLLDVEKDVSVTVVGECACEFRNVKVLGKYRREELSDVLEQLLTDVVFVPSVCPETFSYVTAEATSMDLPVACFPLGAPAERMAEYAKGLVVSEISARVALREIVDFVSAAGKGDR